MKKILSEISDRVRSSRTLFMGSTFFRLNALAPLYVAIRLWGRRYTLKQVRVVDGATLDPLSPTWHTISFQAMLEGTPVSYVLTLNRETYMMEVERGDPNTPDLLELPFELVDETNAVILGVGMLPAIITAIIGSPVYAARRIYFALKTEQARRLGLRPESHALYQALAPHLDAKVAELLLDVLHKLSDLPNTLSITVTNLEDLRCTLQLADRFEAWSTEANLHTYRWELSGVDVAYAEPVKTSSGAYRYRFSLPPYLSSARESLKYISPEQANDLLWRYKNTRRE